MTAKMKPRAGGDRARLRGNDQAGKLIKPLYTPTAASPQAPALREAVVSATVKCFARAWDEPAPISAVRARRQLPARPHIADEPRRASYVAIDRMVSQLPYGYFCDAAGRIVVFNRRYTPIWQRHANGVIEPANPHEWVEWAEERWFDAVRIRYEKNTRDRLREILRKFFAGEDLERFTTDDVRYRTPAKVPR